MMNDAQLHLVLCLCVCVWVCEPGFPLRTTYLSYMHAPPRSTFSTCSGPPEGTFEHSNSPTQIWGRVHPPRWGETKYGFSASGLIKMNWTRLSVLPSNERVQVWACGVMGHWVSIMNEMMATTNRESLVQRFESQQKNLGFKAIALG